MARVVATIAGVTGVGGPIGALGELWTVRPGLAAAGSTEIFSMALPAGTNGVNRRPCWAQYNALTRSRKYGVGAWTSNILIDENMRVLRQGPPAPTIVPTVAVAAGPGVTNSSTCRLRFYDMLGGRCGPTSAPAPPLALVNQQRAWTLLPTTCPDPSMSHLQGIVEVDGAQGRVAWTRQLGVTAVTEGVATGVMGEAAPADFTDMPTGNINAIYHYTQWIAGNQQFPEKCFRSAIGDPERFEGAFVQTDGESVCGFFLANNNFIFGSHERIYRATGFENTDLGREIEKPDIGLVGHHGIVLVHGRAVVPTNVGFFLYAGGWQFLTEDRQAEWIRDYRTYRGDFDAATGFFDPVARVYRFGPVRSSEVYLNSPGDLWCEWILDCQKLFPEHNQGVPEVAWTMFARGRKVEGYSLWTTPGSAQGTVVSGGCDGEVRNENDESNSNDDGDSYGKKLVIEPPAIMPDPGGSSQDGNTFHKAWSYMESENSAWDAEFRGGTVNARTRNAASSFTDTTPASAVSDVEAESKHPHILEGCAGDALQHRVVVPTPRGVKWRGWGGTFGPGITGRGPTSGPIG